MSIVLAKNHRSTPRVGGMYSIVPSATFTDDHFAENFFVPHGVEQLYFEMLVTARVGTSQCTPRLRAILPSGALSIRGYGPVVNSEGTWVFGYGVGADTGVDAKTDRVLITDVEYEMRFNHVDAQAMTYRVKAFVF